MAFVESPNNESTSVGLKYFGFIFNILTLNGDIYYDYGKLYQSILGYDLVLNNYLIDKEYVDFIETYF